MAVTIYIITNKLNGKQYIGQTNNFDRRMRQYKRYAHVKQAIKHAINKHGWENFEMKPLCIVEDYMADETEIGCIKSYNTMAPNGYNLTTGGQHSNRLKKHSNEFSSEHKAKLKIAWERRRLTPVSDETKNKLSKLRKGRKQSAEHIKRRCHPRTTLCVDTGETFESAKQAAIAYSVCSSGITRAALYGVKCKNKNWKYIEKEDE